MFTLPGGKYFEPLARRSSFWLLGHGPRAIGALERAFQAICRRKMSLAA